jgi:hypothetical protein
MDFTGIITDIVEVLKDAVVWLINGLIELLSNLIGMAASFLPNWEIISPYTFGDDPYNVIKALNWLFPVSFAVQMIGVLLASTILYFTAGTITRWAKITGG